MLQIKLPTHKFNIALIIICWVPIKCTPKPSGMILVCHLISYGSPPSPRPALPESGAQKAAAHVHTVPPKPALHRKVAADIKHFFLRSSWELVLRHALHLRWGMQRRYGLGRQAVISRKGTKCSNIHTSKKVCSKNPNFAGKKTQPAASLNMLVKSAGQICRLGFQQPGAHCLPSQ